MDQNQWTFNEHGEYVSAFCQPELGPLRPSSLTDAEKAALPHPWAFLDHDELPYETTADHRTTEGRIVPRGTRCMACRRAGVVQLRVLGSLDGTIVLDAKRWCTPIEGAPMLTATDFPELFLPA